MVTLSIYALNHPFKGVLKLEPTAYQKIFCGEHLFIEKI